MNERELFNRVIVMRRAEIHDRVYRQLNGVIRYGQLAGCRIVRETSWGVDKAAKLLGFYEQEILSDLAAACAGHYFVDVGAADGYYVTGFLKNGVALGACAFEATEEGRHIIARNCAANDVRAPLAIFGRAEEGFLDLIPYPLERCVFLMDVEGAEFELLSEANLARLQRSSLFVEIHDFTDEARESFRRLVERASSLFEVAIIRRQGRDPYAFRELDAFDDTDHWLACSEGRAPDAKWLRLTPRPVR